MRKAVTLLVFICVAVPQLFAIVFRFENEDGRKFRFKNLVRQDVYRNGAFFRSLEMMNKAMLEVQESVSNVGWYKGKFYYYEKDVNQNEPFKLKTVYESEFYKDGQGRMTVAPDVLMPSLRSLPVFPTNDVKPGESWSATGEEIHEGILERDNIIRFPIDVYYKYLGDERIDGRVYAKVTIDYHVIHHPRQDPDIFNFTGFSHTLYYWDILTSEPGFYTEDYAFMFTLRNGETVYYTGSTEGKMDEVSDITNVQKQKIIAELSNTAPKDSGISVKDVADGIIVNLGNILFDFNKATLKKEFEKRLANVAEVLRNYPQIDLVVSGHTDNVGSESYNQILSENRAKTVADFLMKRGIAPTRLSYIGYGLKKPIADNGTEEWRQLNRRVEIKLITKE